MWDGWRVRRKRRVAFVTPILRGWREEGVNPLLKMGEGDEQGNDFSPGGKAVALLSEVRAFCLDAAEKKLHLLIFSW